MISLSTQQVVYFFHYWLFINLLIPSDKGLVGGRLPEF